ncbi:unnamed protein product [Rotaria sp. Silwood1]|nr:unnamed protein product [Rotaria sp. Silwood1]
MTQSKPKFLIAYWKHRELIEPFRLLLKYRNEPFEDEVYNGWLVTDNEPTVADFVAFEYIDQRLVLAPNALDEFLLLTRYMQQFLQSPTLSKYLQDEHDLRPINGKMAHFGSHVVDYR